jgi:hypothetical protein
MIQSCLANIYPPQPLPREGGALSDYTFVSMESEPVQKVLFLSFTPKLFAIASQRVGTGNKVAALSSPKEDLLNYKQLIDAPFRGLGSAFDIFRLPHKGGEYIFENSILKETFKYINQ